MMILLRFPPKSGLDLMVLQPGPGTMFGASVLLGETYMVTAQCLTDCKIMSIGKTPLERIVEANPQMGLVIEKYLAEMYYQRSIDLMHKLEVLIREVPSETEWERRPVAIA